MHLGDAETAETKAATPPSPSTPSSRPPSDPGRFPVGSVVGERFRILRRVGVGGMGEVYQAEDLTLGEVVALKFLPEKETSDPLLRERLVEEVRTARRVTHPNVCRVHDVGELDGQLYLSMEFVDGEDLASLLKRIGRLPEDKALEIARQLCAGLAAAHAKGILHRDLKPGNVMIDGEGRARITDFGLAITGTVEGSGAFAGTPVYMAPEQLAGREVTERSDLYALGLVLYELFTGARPHTGTKVSELLRERSDGNVRPPTSVARALDPGVEALLLECLEPSPEARPRSVHAVAAALPGVDPLDTLLASGETPSPERVAAAGGIGTLPGVRGGVYLGLVVLLALFCLVMNDRVQITGFEALPLKPDVIQHEARRLLARCGYESEPRDTAYSLGANYRLIWHLLAADGAPVGWERLAGLDLPTSVLHWYREGPVYYDPHSVRGRVALRDPPDVYPGMATVLLSPAGRLYSLNVEAARSPDPEPAPFDWNVLFEASGLALADFASVEPDWVPHTAFDQRGAWEGAHPDAPDIPLRVEAAAFEGRPVYYQLGWVWERPERNDGLLDSVEEDIVGLVELAVLIGGVILAWRGLKQGRGDRAGALRLAIAMLILMVLAWLCRAHFAPTPNMIFDNVLPAFGHAIQRAFVVWLVYVALEPYIRRTWPQCLVAWNRLLAGRFLDPMVGRELLTGSLLALIFVAIPHAGALFGAAPTVPRSVDFHTTVGIRACLGQLLDGCFEAATAAFGLVLFLVLVRFVVRSRWLTMAIVGVFVVVLVDPIPTDVVPWDWAQRFVITGLLLWIVVKRGLLVLVVGKFFSQGWSRFPASLDLSSWYAHVTIVLVLLTLVAAIYGYRVACPAWARRAS